MTLPEQVGITGKKYNDENGEVELIPINPMTKKLELEKAEIQSEKQTGYKQRIKEIDYEIKDIYEKAEKLIVSCSQFIAISAFAYK